MKLNGFVGPSYVAQSTLADQEETFNFYTERLESPGATVRWALLPTPGVETLATAGSGPGGCHFYQDGREFAVIGTTFYEISSVGALTSRGTVAVNDNPPTISANGDGELLITSGGNGYLFVLATNTFSTITFLTGKATMGDSVDGYFLVLDSSTSKLWVSDLSDGSSWDPTQFALRQIAPDGWVSMKVHNRYIYLYGSQSTEVWYNTGSLFPFAPHPSGLFQFGCAAPFSPKIVSGALVWVSAAAHGHGTVMRVSGFTPEPVSTDAVEAALTGYGDISDAVGDTYDDIGHTFYVLALPSAGATWCWDATTGHWHRRGSWDADTGAWGVWRPRYHAFAFNEHRMLDSESGQLLRMASTLYTDVGGAVIRRMRRSPGLQYENQRLFYSRFELLLEAGLGATSGQGSDPQVMLRCSNDGGKTWGPELQRSAGALGKYGTMVEWCRLGSGRQRVFEVVVSDPVAWRLLDAFIDVEGLPARGRAA